MDYFFWAVISIYVPTNNNYIIEKQILVKLSLIH
jgi:Tfp pilus assembly protein PilZ